MVDRILLSVKKETDRQYFFSRLKNPLWVKTLRERGYFNKPPGVKHLPDGYVQYPNWPELAYLLSIAEESADEVVSVVLGLPETDNPRIYDDILEITLKLKGRESAKLLPKVIEYTQLENQFFAHRWPDLLCHWATEGNVDEALKAAENLIQFQRDPTSRTKQRLRKKNPDAWGTLLEPVPRFGHWGHQQILEKGLRLLAEKAPYQVARMLVKTTSNMIQMRTHQEDIDKGRDEDHSEIWSRRLNKSNRNHADAKEVLVQTLTYACEQVYDKAPESIVDLDQLLRKQQWKVFRRLRQHLYALHPNEQTMPWIREIILENGDYSKWEHHYEFQLMLRKAIERFGRRLLSDTEQSTIYDAILSGPSKDSFREWMGNQYTEEAFRKRQRYFHRKQLRPFAQVLGGKYRHYYKDLEREDQETPISNEDYSPLGEVSSGWVSHRSPKSAEELDKQSDDELLVYLNDWDHQHHEKDNWLVEINISALADVFRTFFKAKIVVDEKRLAYWLANRDKIDRPIYVAAMVKAMQELIKQKDFENLDRWIEFCAWVLSHLDPEREGGGLGPRDESREEPDWGSSRRAVVDFVDECLKKDVDAPISTRDGIANLLENACTQFDWRLDRDRPVLLNRDDQVTEAVNNTRSRALESLINFGFWIRRRQIEDPLPEITSILNQRLGRDAKVPLTRPEYALLGMHFGNLCALNKDWARKQRTNLFLHEKEQLWGDAFGSFIRFNQPNKPTFDIVRMEFEFALEHLSVLQELKEDNGEVIDRLGQHLFTYYLWRVYPLTGDESFLARFYEKTDNDRKYWANLFHHVGWSLSNSGSHLEKELTDRAIAYFDWRLSAAEPVELQRFAFWLAAKCLEPDWRLQSYSKILDLGRTKNLGLSMEVKTLNRLLSDHTALVVDCLAKITDTLDQGTHMYVQADEAKPILKAGLRTQDVQVRQSAERARENLLRLGRFDFLELE